MNSNRFYQRHQEGCQGRIDQDSFVSFRPSVFWCPTLPMYQNVECLMVTVPFNHDDVIKWKHFPRYWPFVRRIHRAPVNFLSQRPVTRNFDDFFDLHLNKCLNKQSRCWWFETPLSSTRRHCNDRAITRFQYIGVWQCPSTWYIEYMDGICSPT